MVARPSRLKAQIDAGGDAPEFPPPTWRVGDWVRLKGGRRKDYGVVTQVARDTGFVYVQYHEDRANGMAGPPDAFGFADPPWVKPLRRS